MGSNPNAQEWECAGCDAAEQREEAPPDWFILERIGWKPDLVACSRPCLAVVLDGCFLCLAGLWCSTHSDGPEPCSCIANVTSGCAQHDPMLQQVPRVRIAVARCRVFADAFDVYTSGSYWPPRSPDGVALFAARADL